LQEYISGTDPNDPASFLRLDITSGLPGTRTLSFQAQAGNNYSIFYKANLSDSVWTKLTDIPAGQSPSPQNILDNNGTNSTRFYRLVTPQQ
jgi:hypothetical protein